MSILRIKLVESLSKDRYLREDIIDINKLTSSNPQIITEDELEQIESTNDIELIQNFVQKLIDNKILNDDYKSSIVGSIIEYRSLDPKINPVIQIYNTFEDKISADQLKSFEYIFEETSCSNSVIKTYFNEKTNILSNKGKDLEYLIKLVIFLSDKYQAKKYSNGDRSPSIEDDLLDNGKFKPVKEIKKIMDSFTTDDIEKISLAEWVNKLNWSGKDIVINLLKILQDKSVTVPDKLKDTKARNKFWKSIIEKFQDKNNSTYNFVKMSDSVEVDPAWSPDNDQEFIAKAIFDYIKKLDKNPFKDINLKDNQKVQTIKAYLINNKIQLTENVVKKFLKDTILKSQYNQKSKQYLIQSIDNIARDIDLFNLLLEEPLNPKTKTKAQALGQAIDKFLKKNSNIEKSKIITNIDTNKANYSDNTQTEVTSKPSKIIIDK